MKCDDVGGIGRDGNMGWTAIVIVVTVMDITCMNSCMT